MEKLYSENFKNNKKVLAPKAETIQFLLDYSRTLSVTKYKKHQFETILN